MTSVFHKSMKLSAAVLDSMGGGTVSNLMAIDSGKLQDLTPYLHAVWYSFIQISLAMYFLYGVVGFAFLGGVAVILLCMPITANLSASLKSVQTSLSTVRDERVKCTNEVLSGIKVIKLQAWESTTISRINRIRDEELALYRRYLYLNAMSSAFSSSVPLLVAIATFSLYVYNGNDLDVATALTSLSLFDILRFPLSMLPTVVNNLVEAGVCLGRIRRFLLLPECSPVPAPPLQRPGVVLRDATCVWDSGLRASDGNKAGKFALSQLIERLVGCRSWTDRGSHRSGNAADRSALTESEFELLVCKAQLVDANRFIARLETQRKGAIESSDDSANGAEKSDFALNICDGSAQMATVASAGRLLAVSRVSIRAGPGDLLAVVGQVGAGKSSLIAAILGELTVVAGSLAARGAIGYVGQKPYIQNCSVRENILFGQKFEESRYTECIAMCCLLQDMAALPAGDATEIGERGVNLSGGQKARVALARAVYADADVFLLDDPLSAVDTQVARHIFEACILRLLARGKCIVMSTNALQFLSQATSIVVLKEGNVVESGTLAAIGSTGALCEMMKVFSEGHASHPPTGILSLDEHTLPSTVSGTDADVSVLEERPKQAGDGGKLIEVEDRATGDVGREVYMMWATAAGGWTALLAMLALFSAVELVVVLSSWWLTYWSRHCSTSSPWTFLLIYAAINGVLSIGFFVSQLHCRLHCWRAGSVLYRQTLTAVLYSPMSFFDTNPIGRIANRLSKDVYTVDENLPQTIRWYFGSALKVLSSLVYSCVVTPPFIVGLFVIGGFYYTAQRFYVRTSRELSRLESESRSPIYALFSETLEGLVTVKAFRSQSVFLDRMHRLLDSNVQAYFLNFSANCWLAVRLEVAAALGITFAALFAVVGRDESASDEERARFSGLAGLGLSLALSITQSLNWSVRMAADLEGQMVAVERLRTYATLEQEAEHSRPSDPPADSWPSQGRIVFENVCLRYRIGLPRVLSSLSFEVRGGEKIGVVGRTGAGKSSLVVAVMRLVELEAGAIRIDDRDVSKLGLNCLRSAVAVIPQDPVLFSGSLRFNIDPFSQHRDADIWDCLNRLHLGPAIGSLDSDTVANLSAGQRQLICICRALLCKRKIVIMDEATASVDIETDAIIQRAMRREFAHSTVLTVAHRLNTIMDSDKVLVIDMGAAVEMGAPSELLANSNGRFASLVAEWNKRTTNLNSFY